MSLEVVFILVIGCIAVIMSIAVLVGAIRDYRAEKEHQRHMAKVIGWSSRRRIEIMKEVLGRK